MGVIPCPLRAAGAGLAPLLPSESVRGMRNYLAERL
jgi:hypothetical protein